MGCRWFGIRPKMEMGKSKSDRVGKERKTRSTLIIVTIRYRDYEKDDDIFDLLDFTSSITYV